MCGYAYSFSMLHDANSNCFDFKHFSKSRFATNLFFFYWAMQDNISHDQETFITTPSFLCHLELSESPRRDFIRMNFFSKWLVYVLQWLHTPHTRPGHNKTLEKDWCGLGRSKQQVTPSTPLQMHCGVWCHHNPEVPSQWEGPLSTPDQVTLSFPIASSCPTSSRASVKGWHSKCSNRTELSKF